MFLEYISKRFRSYGVNVAVSSALVRAEKTQKHERLSLTNTHTHTAFGPMRWQMLVCTCWAVVLSALVLQYVECQGWAKFAELEGQQGEEPPPEI